MLQNTQLLTFAYLCVVSPTSYTEAIPSSALYAQLSAGFRVHVLKFSLPVDRMPGE